MRTFHLKINMKPLERRTSLPSCTASATFPSRCYLKMIMKPMDMRLTVTPGTVLTKTFG